MFFFSIENCNQSFSKIIWSFKKKIISSCPQEITSVWYKFPFSFSPVLGVNTFWGHEQNKIPRLPLLTIFFKASRSSGFCVDSLSQCYLIFYLMFASVKHFNTRLDLITITLPTINLIKAFPQSVFSRRWFMIVMRLQTL